MNLRFLSIGIVVIITLALVGGLSIYSIMTTQKLIRVESDYDKLLHERNLIDQNYDKMRREYKEKEEIYKMQEAKLQRLEEAKTLEDYIRIWQEVEK